MPDRTYTVVWTRNVRASSHEEAAGFAFEHMSQVDRGANAIFYVSQGGLNPKVIDATMDDDGDCTHYATDRMLLNHFNAWLYHGDYVRFKGTEKSIDKFLELARSEEFLIQERYKENVTIKNDKRWFIGDNEITREAK